MRSDGNMGWEFIAEFDGPGASLEAADFELVEFPRDESISRQLEERLRVQFRNGMKLTSR